jgi:hypothetical protein
VTYLKNYLSKVKATGNVALAQNIIQTINYANSVYIDNFDYSSHITSLLVGHVQSGKTSHMFGLIASSASKGFNIFVVLTTDNILLQNQTLERVQNDLSNFCICGENDYIKFIENNLRLPVIIVLKKNAKILKKWKDNFSSTNFVAGNPLFIIDDEADAASLNTKINIKHQTSTINKHLCEIINSASSSIYLQVTGTPQAILLQNELSDLKPDNIYFFEPGANYIGGNLLFVDNLSPYIVLTDDDEPKAILEDDEFPENNLKTALLTHLITSAHIFVNKIDTVSNFVIHPSVKIDGHNRFAEKIGVYLNELNLGMDDELTIEALHQAHLQLSSSQDDLLEFNECINFIRSTLRDNAVNIRLLNSIASFEENRQYNAGINIIVGGNSLGRGVTFSKLQTIYYCRTSKTPQADTMWQHARMFGYDRITGLVRIFMPPLIFKLFSDINITNNYIISQIKQFNATDKVKILYSKKIRPTRKNVLDNNTLITIAGNVNYFPFEADNDNIEQLDAKLSKFKENEEYYQVSLKLIEQLIKHCSDLKETWSKKSFINFLGLYLSENASAQGVLIVRRDRDLSKGTGTLLSPDDRRLGASFSNQVVLTMYKVTGSKDWLGKKTWIPNIKLPNDVIYYDIKKVNEK